jgi:hypothetical protein
LQKPQKGPNCEIGIVWPQFIGILYIHLISMSMHYHTARVMGNCPSPNIILLQTCNLGNVIFARSILSWIMHRNSSFNHTNSILHMWYKFLHDFWCKICFLSFSSYLIASLLFLPTFDIKFLRDSQIVHLAKTDLRFHTLTFRWYLFFNLFMAD